MRVVYVEGTPEELAKFPQLAELLSPKTGRDGGHNGHAVRGVTAGGGGIPAGGRPGLESEAEALIERRTPPSARGRVQRIVDEILSWPGVDGRRGLSRKTADGLGRYVRFHRTPSNLGAFAYLKPSNLALNLRLPKSAAAKSEHAKASALPH